MSVISQQLQDPPALFTPLAATTWNDAVGVLPIWVYSISTQRQLQEYRHDGDQWTDGISQTLDISPFTPLAVISWKPDNSPHHTRVYYLSANNKLQEYSSDNDVWTHRGLNDMHVQAAPNSSIAAVQYTRNNSIYIHVYYQGKYFGMQQLMPLHCGCILTYPNSVEGSNQIKEYYFNGLAGSWKEGATVTSAMSGTSIGAVSYHQENPFIKIVPTRPNSSCTQHVSPLQLETLPFLLACPSTYTSLCNVWYHTETTMFVSLLAAGVVQLSHVMCAMDVYGGHSYVYGTILSGYPRYIALIYYQATDLSIHEYCLDGDTTWVPGQFNGGTAPGQTQIGVLVKGYNNGPVLDVYWMNTASEIIRRPLTNGTWNTSDVVGPLVHGARFSPTLFMLNGQYILQVYYQQVDNSILEFCQNGPGQSWVPGATLATG
ncbi:hypothetical protein C8Q74DRAFT_1377865 [Fomes fomentarius]|nr:hypothetical protein C8Q74DRAFT_1377865 [Fomes fomentarius]